MKLKVLSMFLTIIPILFLMACTSTPNFSTTKQEQHQMNNTVQYANKTLWEMFGHPEDWELYVYSIPLEIDFVRPPTIHDLRSKEYSEIHRYLNDNKVVYAINLFKNILFTYGLEYPIDVRILLDFKHKYKNETISLVNDGYTLAFYVERNIDGQIEKLPAIVVSDEQYNMLKQLFSN